MDLLSQAEHDEEAKPILISNNKNFIKLVNNYLIKFLNEIKRKKIASKSIKSNGLAIYIKNLDDAYLVANLLAPEHLEILSENKNILIKNITNAGAIFVENILQSLLEIM